MKNKKAAKTNEDPLAIPEGMLGGHPHVVINDFSFAELCGCDEIITYEDHLIRVSTKGGIIAVIGEGLVMRSFYGSQITVCGRIDSVEFLRRER